MNEDVFLSTEGQQRSREILAAAKAAARRRRRVRQGRWTACAALVTLSILGLLESRDAGQPLLSHREHEVEPISAPAPDSGGPSTVQAPWARRKLAQHAAPQSIQVAISRFHTDTAITDRLSLRTTGPAYQRIGDEELLKRLHDVGRPAALMSIQGVEQIVFASR